jgi:carbonic anhydrase/acetyltransferase-like protein (isoleucine patch superfamily)
MIIEHLKKKPDIHPSAYVAPNATVCGDLEIGMGTRIMDEFLLPNLLFFFIVTSLR